MGLNMNNKKMKISDQLKNIGNKTAAAAAKTIKNIKG